MVNQKRLAHKASDLSTKEKNSLEPGYSKSLGTLQDELIDTTPKPITSQPVTSQPVTPQSGCVIH